MERIIIFGDSCSWVTTILLKATLQEIQKVNNMQVVAVCDASLSAPRSYPNFLSHKIIRDILIRLFNPEYRFLLKTPLLENLYSVAHRFNIKVITPKRRNINHAEFIQFLRDDLKPTICISYYCLQVFNKKLLKSFERSVNFHNSHLPQYRGLAATSWSMYNGELQSGFTFHYMNEKIEYLRTQIGNPDGADQPNKKYYDPRKWLRLGEDTFKARLIQAFEDLNNVNTL